MATDANKLGQKAGSFLVNNFSQSPIGSQLSKIDPVALLQQLAKMSSYAGNAMSSMTPMSPMMQLPEALIKGANKALTKLGEQYAVEAANTPGGLQSLSQQLNQPKITMAEQQLSPEQLAASPTNQFAKDANKAQSTELNSLLVPQGQAQAPQAMPQPQAPMAQPQSMSQNPLAILSQLGNMMHTPGSFNQQIGDVKNPTFFGMESEEANQRFLENQIRKQQLTGNVPLQKGEREKLEIESENKFFESVNKSLSESQKPLSAESAKVLGNVDSGLSQVNELISQLQSNPKFFRQLNVPGNPKGQALSVMVEDLSDIIGRLRSGGAINADEEKRFKRQLPSKGFMANLEDPKTAMFKLKKLQALFSDIRSTTKPRESNYAIGIQKALQSGATREQLWRLHKEGKI